MKKFNKILALCVALVLVVGCFAACGNGGSENKATGMSESPLPAPEIVKDYDIPADFKIGFICLHDENSTYDLNFLNAVDAIQKATGLKDEQVIVKTNIGEDDACYNTAKDLATQGCKIIFANILIVTKLSLLLTGNFSIYPSSRLSSPKVSAGGPSIIIFIQRS